MKILITGANGMLAKAVRERFKNHNLVCTESNELDITNFQRVQEFVFDCKTEVIINCAAYTAIDKAEENEKLAMKVNGKGPRNLAIAANSIGTKLVHISTDYVFGGSLPTTKVHFELDDKFPETVYGITKLAGEKAIKENMALNYYIFRTTWLFGDGNNFVRTMLNLGKQKEKVTVDCNQFGSPTYTEDLAEIIYQALKKRIPYGIYHATNLGFTSQYDFAKEIFKQAELKVEVIPAISEEIELSAKRPQNSMLSKSKILDAGINIPTWENALGRYLKKELNKP